MKEQTLVIAGERIVVRAQKINEQLWIHYNGKTLVVEPKPSKRRSSNALAVSSDGQIQAPMPGKVIKINKAVGDSVVTEETVVVLEAMKMEYSLKANIDGLISRIGVKEGDLVKKDQSLIVIDKTTDRG